MKLRLFFILLAAVVIGACRPADYREPFPLKQVQSPTNLQYESNRCCLGTMSVANTEQLIFTLEDVLFDFNKAKLKPRAWDVLRVVAQHLQSNPRYQAYVEGHTDSIGSTQYNMSLGLKRAKSVRTALGELGIPSSRVDVQSYGESRPLADNRTDAGRQKNRRVEIILR